MKPAPLRRHIPRGTYDLASVTSVFNDCFIAHVSYVDDDGSPACLPMVALVQEEDVERDGEGEREARAAVYLHGHPSTKLMELVRRAARMAEEAGGGDTNGDGYGPPSEEKGKGTVRVCITATKVDGLVLSSAPNGHAFNYRSAVIHGSCSPVTDKSIKRSVMRGVTNHIVANRWEEVNPVASFQVSLVYVIRVDIASMSVKTRTGVPGIQPRNVEVDGPDCDVKPWTGVVPLYETLGTPVDSGLSEGAVVSENLRCFIDERNQRQKIYAESVTK